MGSAVTPPSLTSIIAKYAEPTISFNLLANTIRPPCPEPISHFATLLLTHFLIKPPFFQFMSSIIEFGGLNLGLGKNLLKHMYQNNKPANLSYFQNSSYSSFTNIQHNYLPFFIIPTKLIIDIRILH